MQRFARPTYIASGLRTPFGRGGGALADHDAISLSVPLAKAMAAQARPDLFIWGTVIPSLGWSNIGREIWLDAGLDPTVPAFSTVLACSTSMVAALTAAVRRSSLLTSEQSKGVKMNFTATQLTLSSSSPDVGDSEITMPLEGFQGEPIEVGFNPGYIVDALKIIDAPEVIIELKATNKPGVLRIGQEFTYVIMPLNV